MHQYFTPFDDQIMYHRMDRPHLFVHSSVNGHSHLLVVVSSAAMNLSAQTVFEHLLSSLLTIYLEAELLDHMLILNLIFGGNLMIFSTVVYHFTFP